MCLIVVLDINANASFTRDGGISWYSTFVQLSPLEMLRTTPKNRRPGVACKHC